MRERPDGNRAFPMGENARRGTAGGGGGGGGGGRARGAPPPPPALFVRARRQGCPLRRRFYASGAVRLSGRTEAAASAAAGRPTRRTASQTANTAEKHRAEKRKKERKHRGLSLFSILYARNRFRFICMIPYALNVISRHAVFDRTEQLIVNGAEHVGHRTRRRRRPVRRGCRSHPRRRGPYRFCRSAAQGGR